MNLQRLLARVQRGDTLALLLFFYLLIGCLLVLAILRLIFWS